MQFQPFGPIPIAAPPPHPKVARFGERNPREARTPEEKPFLTRLLSAPEGQDPDPGRRPSLTLAGMWGRDALQGVRTPEDLFSKADFRISGSVLVDGENGEKLAFIAARKDTGDITLTLTSAFPSPAQNRLSPTLRLIFKPKGLIARYIAPDQLNAPPLSGTALRRAEALSEALFSALIEAAGHTRFYAVSQTPRPSRAVTPAAPDAEPLAAELLPGLQWMRPQASVEIGVSSLTRQTRRPMNGRNGCEVWRTQIVDRTGRPLGPAELELAEVRHPGSGRRAGLVTLRLWPDGPDNPGNGNSRQDGARLILVAYLPANAPKTIAHGLQAPPLLALGESMALLAQTSASDRPHAVQDPQAAQAYPAMIACAQAMFNAIQGQQGLKAPAPTRKPLCPTPEPPKPPVWKRFKDWMMQGTARQAVIADAAGEDA